MEPSRVDQGKFWNLRVAQDKVARCAAKLVTPKTGSETCALRKVIWRVAQWAQETIGL
ncbi:hypothetical protein A2U01_0058587, partial [Trifolium medium]|nr:hypothetical protein [Trifolium medium]